MKWRETGTETVAVGERSEWEAKSDREVKSVTCNPASVPGAAAVDPPRMLDLSGVACFAIYRLICHSNL